MGSGEEGEVVREVVKGGRAEMLLTFPGGVGAELGVAEGDFSREILRRVDCKKLFLVDKFEGEISMGRRRVDLKGAYERMRRKFAGSVVEVVAAESVAWLRGLREGALDWVYIDTTHEYQQTRSELEAAFCAVRVGGLVTGHDFCPRWGEGVIRAVSELVEKKGLALQVWDDGRTPKSYRIVVPEKT